MINGMMMQTNNVMNTAQNICTVVGAGFIIYKTCTIAYHMGERNAMKQQDNGFAFNTGFKN